MLANDILEFNPGKLSHRIWTIASVAKPIDRAGMAPAKHSFIILTDDSKGIVLDELHFMREGYINGTPVKAQHPDLKPRDLVLRASTYVEHRKSDDFPSVRYKSGAPLEMIAAWNKMCDAARSINALKRPFGKEYNCRVGAKAVLGVLGYDFTAHDLLLGKITPAKFSGQIDTASYVPSLTPSALLAEHQRLHELLKRTEKLKPQETALKF